MGIFDNIDNGEKRRIVDIELSTAKVHLYGLLIQIGIDPDSFNHDEWSEPIDMGGEPRGRVKHYIDLIATLEEKRAALTNE